VIIDDRHRTRVVDALNVSADNVDRQIRQIRKDHEGHESSCCYAETGALSRERDTLRDLARDLESGR